MLKWLEQSKSGSTVESVMDDPLFQLGSIPMEDAKQLARKIVVLLKRSKNAGYFSEFCIASLKAIFSVPASINCLTTRSTFS